MTINIRRLEFLKDYFAPLLCVLKEGYHNKKYFLFISLLVQRNEPKKSRPGVSWSAYGVLPSPGTFSRGCYELAHSGAQTA